MLAPQSFSDSLTKWMSLDQADSRIQKFHTSVAVVTLNIAKNANYTVMFLFLMFPVAPEISLIRSQFAEKSLLVA